MQYHALEGTVRGFRQDLYKIFWQAILQDPEQDLHARTPTKYQTKSSAAGEDLTNLDTRTSRQPPQEL